MDLYAQNILDHYRHPRNYRKLSSPSAARREVNDICGDALDIEITVREDTIDAIGFQGEGCAVSQAAMSILSEYATHKSVAEIEKIRFHDLVKLLGVDISERRKKCALLGLLGLRNALADYARQPPKDWKDVV